LESFFRFSFIILLFYSTLSFSQEHKHSDSTGNISVAQLESTVALLKDSTKLKLLINDIEGIINAEKVSKNSDVIAAGKEKSVRNHTVGSPLMFSSLEQFSVEIGNVYTEVMTGSVFLSDFFDAVNVNATRNLLLFSLIVIVALITGTVVWMVLKRICGRQYAKVQKKDSINEWNGYLFIVLDRISVGTGLSIVLLILHFPFGKTPFGELLFHFSIAVALYSFASAMLHLLFSKKFPQYRMIRIENKTISTISKSLSSIVVFAFLFWLFVNVLQFIKWQSSAVMASGVYKSIISIQVSFLTYHLRFFKGTLFPRSVLTDKFSLFVSDTYQFIVSKLYIPVFIFFIVLTISSFSDDKSTYDYLLRSVILTLLLLAGISLLFWILGAFLKKIQLIGNKTDLNKSYVDLLLITNKKTIERGGYLLILLSGLFLLVNIWGIDIFRLAKSDVPMISSILHLFFIVSAALIFVQISQFLIKGFQMKAEKSLIQSGTTEIEVKKRLETLGTIFQKISFTTIGVIAAIMIIDELGFDIKAMLAGVGIVGLAVGFGAQNLVRDVISGLFIIFENRIRVGDVAIINGTGGHVEQVNLRTIVLRSVDGTIHVFPNGAITSLSNMTHEYSYYVFDIGIEYKENVDHVIETLKKVGESMLDDDQFRNAILEPLEVFGLDRFGASEVIIKARIKTVPIKQWEIGREMNRRIKIAFDKEGIEIPFPHQSINFGENSSPIRVKIEGVSDFLGKKAI
jgi:small conductance mechanosensitive channel